MRFSNQAEWEAFENTGKMPFVDTGWRPKKRGFWAWVKGLYPRARSIQGKE